MANREDEVRRREKQEKEEEIEELLDRYKLRLGGAPTEQPDNHEIRRSSKGKIISREYKEYLEEEEAAAQLNWYEKLCQFSHRIYSKGIEPSEDTAEELERAREFLDWRIRIPDALFSGVVVGTAFFFVAILIFLLNNVIFVSCAPAPGGGQQCSTILPSFVMMLLFVAPLGIGYYLSLYPKFAAKTKVIKSSESMILAILYMVVYMRSSPNLEGAVRFAATNLSGPIADDLKRVLWSVETGDYSTIDEALAAYARRWKPFNRDFVQSLELLQAILQEPSEERRQQLYNEALDSILSGSREKMEHFSRELRLPIAVLEGLGILLPVLGMILFPLVATFIGGENLGTTLFLLYDVLLPITLFIIMNRILVNRPPSITSQPTREDLLPEAGAYTFYIGDRRIQLPIWVVAAFVTLLFAGWPIVSYTLLFVRGESLAQAVSMQELLRSIFLIMGIGFGMGTYLTLGYKQRAAFQERLKHIEEEFPEAMFQLGISLKGGRPIELGIARAIEDTRDLDISEMFIAISRNIRDLSMTFKQAIFDPEYGALRQFPSKLVETVMKAVVQSVDKGTDIASVTILTIARYLKDVHAVQEKIKDLLEETLSSVQFMGYILAPVIAGVAVGMGTIITKALTIIGVQLNETQQVLSPANATELGGTPGAGGLGGFFQFGAAVPPELIQIVVGLYIIILSMILGTFYVRLNEGENKTVESLQIGRYLFIGTLIYAITTIIIAALFGGIIGSLQA